MKTVRHDDDDLNIGRLVHDGSSAWIGPSPLVQHSRWAAAAQRGRWLGRALKLTVGATAFTALAFVSVMFIAALASPDGNTTVSNLMSHVFSGGAEPSPGVVSPSPLSTSPAAPQHGGAAPPSSTSRPGPTSTPSRQTPEHEPSPRPSQSPDE